MRRQYRQICSDKSCFTALLQASLKCPTASIRSAINSSTDVTNVSLSSKLEHIFSILFIHDTGANVQAYAHEQATYSNSSFTSLAKR